MNKDADIIVIICMFIYFNKPRVNIYIVLKGIYPKPEYKDNVLYSGSLFPKILHIVIYSIITKGENQDIFCEIFKGRFIL